MRENIELNGRKVTICHPEKPNGKWALKTEYFDAFPEVQNILLNKGYYITYMENNCTIKTIIKKDGEHHPHSLPDNSPIIDFILEHDI